MSERQTRIFAVPGLWAERGISYVESDRVSFLATALTFVFAVTLSNYLKLFSSEIRYPPFELLHSLMFHASLSLSIGLLLHFVTGTSMFRTLKLVLTCFVLVIIVPIIDLLLPCEIGVDIGHFEFKSTSDILVHFLNFGGPSSGYGASFGQRVSVALAVLGCYFYARSKQRNRKVALLAAGVAYVITFVHSSWPFVLKAILSIGGIRPDYSNELFAGSFALFVFVAGIIAAYRADRIAFASFSREFNTLRFVHYICMFGWGFVRTAPGYPFVLDQTTLLNILLVTASFFLALLFIIPLERMSRGETESDGRILIFIGLSLFYASLAGFEYGFLMGLFLGNLYIYHAPPVALHRIRFVARIGIAANSLLLIIAGYMIRKQGPRDLFPWIVVVIMVGAAVFGLVELVWGKTRPHSHRARALLAGHLASVATMVVYQVIIRVFKGL